LKNVHIRRHQDGSVLSAHCAAGHGLFLLPAAIATNNGGTASATTNTVGLLLRQPLNAHDSIPHS
jgi:hypothetical protein